MELIIYNLLRRKFEKIFDLEGALCFLSVYPQESAYDSKEFLYSADQSGVLNLFYIRHKPFKKAYRIETKCQKEILSVVLFYDVFEEIECDSLVKIYALVVFNDPF